MKAIVQDRYGAPDAVLEPGDIDRPVVSDDQVLMRVRAAGLHAGDCFTVRGAPFPVRMATGLFRPGCGVPGYDVAGRVEVVGHNVKRFKPGDEVFGACTGACAGYVCAGEGELAHKHVKLSLEEAAAIPTSALAAHNLYDRYPCHR